MKKNLVLLTVALLLVLTACGGGGDKPATTTEPAKTDGELTKVVIGVSPAPHGEIVEGLEEEFKAAGIEVEIVTFDDYVQPNLALDDGSLDLNYFQHQPYLDSFIAEHGVELVTIGQVHVEPLALYSDKYESIEELPEGAEIIIPSDPTNGARALLLLQSAGLIELSDPTNLAATEADITENPKNFKFTAIDPANIARTYTDVDGGVINANFAIDAGLNPMEDGILVEGDQSPYANVVVVKAGEESNETFLKVVEILNSDASRKFIEEKYEGTIKPVF
ncbi:MAG: MetQ/NlpA family ABC transporter substrate-binding protein [Tissierellia bacterium]|nr:MetQ/NlpA family ABC transporter substrate-binding protein [Tissierellia bacterium]